MRVVLALALASSACLGPTFPKTPPAIDVDVDDAAAPTDAPAAVVADAAAAVGADTAAAPRDGGSSPETATPDLARPADAVAAPDLAASEAPARPDAGAPVGDGGSPSALFGFENAAPDWRSEHMQLMRDTTKVTEGSASLMFVATRGYSRVTSRLFATNELAFVAARLSVDVYLTANEGKTLIGGECMSANLGGMTIGEQPLAGLPVDRWNTLTFTMPRPFAAALAGQHTGCKMWIEHTSTGVTRYDRMTFVP